MHIFKSRQLTDQKCPENRVSLNTHTFSSCYFLKLHSVKSGDCLKEDWGNGPRGTGLASTHTVHTRTWFNTERYDTCGLELEFPKPTCLRCISCCCDKNILGNVGGKGFMSAHSSSPSPSQKSQWWELEGVGHIVSVTGTQRKGRMNASCARLTFFTLSSPESPPHSGHTGMLCHLN